MYQGFYNIFNSPGILYVIELLRLEWIMFIATIDDGRTVRKLPEGKPGEGSNQGRPRLWWLDE
jgi:hypothetical protein